jgi:hypothetical protein
VGAAAEATSGQGRSLDIYDEYETRFPRQKKQTIQVLGTADAAIIKDAFADSTL